MKKIFYKLYKKLLLFRRYIIFIFGGGLGLVINLLITFVLTEYFYLWHMFSYSIGLTLNIIINYIYHTKITFKIERSKNRLIKFVVVFLLMVLLNWFFVYYFTEIIGFKKYYLIVIVAVTFVLSIINYLINKLYVFKK